MDDDEEDLILDTSLETSGGKIPTDPKFDSLLILQAVNQHNQSTNDAMQNRQVQTNGTQQRVRQYTASINGPFTVIIREQQMKIAPLNFAAYVNKKYTSVCLIKRSQGKMNIVLNLREEANALARDPYFALYHVYIPADIVEIEGAICADDLCDMDDLKILTSTGKGIFGNTLLSSCDILEARTSFPCCRRSIRASRTYTYEYRQGNIRRPNTAELHRHRWAQSKG